MAEHSIIAVYDTMAKAEEAVYALDRGGLPLKQVSIVAQDLQSEKVVHGYVTVENMAQKGVITGAWAGGLLGLLTCVAFMWIPGFGPLIVAGRLASVLLGLLGGSRVSWLGWPGVASSAP